VHLTARSTDKTGMSLEEQNKLTLLIGRISYAWSLLENDLTYLLSAIIADGPEERLAAAILNSTSSVDAKLTIVDESFKVIVSHLPESARVYQAWKATYRRIGKQKRTRNAAVHGTFMGSERGICLAPPTFSPKFWREITGKKQRVGVTAHEIQQAIDSIEDLRARVQLIGRLILFWREENTEAYARKLLDL
jgi:hypothetical protein